MNFLPSLYPDGVVVAAAPFPLGRRHIFLKAASDDTEGQRRLQAVMPDRGPQAVHKARPITAEGPLPSAACAPPDVLSAATRDRQSDEGLASSLQDRRSAATLPACPTERARRRTPGRRTRRSASRRPRSRDAPPSRAPGRLTRSRTPRRQMLRTLRSDPVIHQLTVCLTTEDDKWPKGTRRGEAGSCC